MEYLEERRLKARHLSCVVFGRSIAQSVRARIHVIAWPAIHLWSAKIASMLPNSTLTVRVVVALQLGLCDAGAIASAVKSGNRIWNRYLASCCVHLLVSLSVAIDDARLKSQCQHASSPSPRTKRLWGDAPARQAPVNFLQS